MIKRPTGYCSCGVVHKRYTDYSPVNIISVPDLTQTDLHEQSMQMQRQSAENVRTDRIKSRSVYKFVLTAKVEIPATIKSACKLQVNCQNSSYYCTINLRCRNSSVGQSFIDVFLTLTSNRYSLESSLGR